MPNSYVKPFEAQVTANTIAMNCGLIDLTQYVERPGTDPTYCEYENAGSTAKLGEVISVKVFQTNATSLSKQYLQSLATHARLRKDTSLSLSMNTSKG